VLSSAYTVANFIENDHISKNVFIIFITACHDVRSVLGDDNFHKVTSTTNGMPKHIGIYRFLCGIRQLYFGKRTENFLNQKSFKFRLTIERSLVSCILLARFTPLSLNFANEKRENKLDFIKLFMEFSIETCRRGGKSMNPAVPRSLTYTHEFTGYFFRSFFYQHQTIYEKGA
jgi:hypothetical protein